MSSAWKAPVKRLTDFFRKEIVLTLAWVLALLSMLLVPPDRGYLDYVDFHTLGLLFALMAVMAGLQALGLFRRMGQAILNRTHSTLALELVLVLLPFFSGMVVTNDVALITFVPFALEVLTLAGLNKRAVPVVVLQTVAANLGSMATPIGNPQNLYLYSRFSLSMGQFFRQMLPLTAVSLVLLVLWVCMGKKAPVTVPAADEKQPPMDKKRLVLHLGLFVLCLLVVAGVLPLLPVVVLTLVGLLVLDRKALLGVDYGLLATFVGFFLFVGNLGRLPVFTRFFESIVEGREVLCSVAASQVISNVPAALLLSGFTDNWKELLLGVNLGGLGTLIASMASLISYKAMAKVCPGEKGSYMLRFTLVNLVFLALLLGAWAVLY